MRPCRLRKARLTSRTPRAMRASGARIPSPLIPRIRRLSVNIVDPSLSRHRPSSSADDLHIQRGARRQLRRRRTFRFQRPVVDRGFAACGRRQWRRRSTRRRSPRPTPSPEKAHVSVASGDFTDAVGNAGVGGSDPSPSTPRIRRLTGPDIVDGALSDGHNGSVVTFTLLGSTGRLHHRRHQRDARHGQRLGCHRGPAGLHGHLHRRATASPAAARSLVAAGSYTDAALNLGGTGRTPSPSTPRIRR